VLFVTAAGIGHTWKERQLLRVSLKRSNYPQDKWSYELTFCQNFTPSRQGTTTGPSIPAFRRLTSILLMCWWIYCRPRNANYDRSKRFWNLINYCISGILLCNKWSTSTATGNEIEMPKIIRISVSDCEYNRLNYS